MTTKLYDRIKGKWVVVNDVTTELTDISPIDSQHILGRISSGNGAVESLSKANVKSILGYLETEQDFADLIQAQSNIVSDYGSWIVPVVNGIYRTVDYITTSNLKNYVLTGLTTSDVSGLQTALNNKLDASAYNQHYKSVYLTIAELETAHPAATAGDYALVDAGNGQDAIFYIWDSSDTKWVSSGSAVLSTTDSLTEGSTNLYWTNNRSINAVLTGFSSASGITSSYNIQSAIQKLANSTGTIKFDIVTNQTSIPIGIADTYQTIGFDCVVTGWCIVSKQTGDVVVDILLCPYSAFPPVAGTNSITGSNKPTLVSSNKNQNLSISPTWTLTKGYCMAFNIISCVNIQTLSIVLFIQRT